MRLGGGGDVFIAGGDLDVFNVGCGNVCCFPGVTECFHCSFGVNFGGSLEICFGSGLSCSLGACFMVCLGCSFAI